MSFTFKYVSASCPELTEAEVKVVIENLQTDSRYNSLNEQGVRDFARSLFPHVLNKARYIDGRDRMDYAIRLLKAASNELNKMPTVPDDVGRTDLDIKMAIYYLEEQLHEIVEGKTNVE